MGLSLLNKVAPPPHLLYVPTNTPIVEQEAIRKDPAEVRMPPVWEAFFRLLQAMVQLMPRQLYANDVEGQAAAIGATAIPFPVDTSSLYRITARLRVATPADSSSTVTVTIRWTEKAGATAAQVSKTLATNVLGDQVTLTELLEPDLTQPLTFEVAYASVGAQDLVYDLDVLLEDLPS